MADSSVPITDANDATVNVDARTISNGDKRQVVTIGDGGTPDNIAPVDPTNGLAVDVKQSALPSGAATETTLDAVKTRLSGSSRSDTYTVAGNGTTVDVSALPRKFFAIQVKGTGATPTSWTAELQASLDGTNFAAVLTHTNESDSDGSIVWASTPTPALYFRSRITDVDLGSATNVVITILGVS